MPFGKTAFGRDIVARKQEKVSEGQGELTSDNVPYSESYKELCFQAWYASGRPAGKSLVSFLPVDEFGRKPQPAKVAGWRDIGGWHGRADELDRQGSKEMETYAIEKKVEMFKRHADVARQLTEKGLDWLGTHEPDKSADAIRLVVEGIRIEKESVGVPDALLKIAAMNDQEITEVIGQYLNRVSGRERAELLDKNIVTVDIEEAEIIDESTDD